ncbi:hypothetical protein BU23DRAFT_556599 [Bimuria novae-zelandiae CBS 107.79]|uniref:EthD domain-containing protein n=1 Tax=Bimuria novae-zelandiae CBS 107.79 TaxID=1447943 RepID=A0A6A5V180_9PLEO|nr:hypothetical protein BU23DRAFT_556599 [Bimuria novae-zelandiae CBS 107.79]
MAEPIKGPGILYVKAAINPSPSNPLTEAQYMHWYDDDHIAEIVSTSGMPNAFRYFHVDKTPDHGKPTPECPRPYLAFYPMPDLAFTQGQEFKGIGVKSALLPGTGICYDMADTDVGYYALIGQRGNSKKGRSGEQKPGRIMHGLRWCRFRKIPRDI